MQIDRRVKDAAPYGVNDKSQFMEEVTSMKEDRFKKILVDGGGMSENYMAIYVDRKTGVNYLFTQSGYAGGLCVLVDREGKPIVSPLPIED